LADDPFELTRIKDTKRFLTRLVLDIPSQRNLSSKTQIYQLKKKDISDPNVTLVTTSFSLAKSKLVDSSQGMFDKYYTPAVCAQPLELNHSGMHGYGLRKRRRENEKSD
tara:strand:- start:379 stop:705 length:327 start_codon:yes stop_codon:yes gene_type:complete